jgi:hypothetical protein
LGNVDYKKIMELKKGSGSTAPNPAMARDNLLAVGVVMSRGLASTSHPDQPETSSPTTTLFHQSHRVDSRAQKRELPG